MCGEEGQRAAQKGGGVSSALVLLERQLSHLWHGQGKPSLKLTRQELKELKDLEAKRPTYIVVKASLFHNIAQYS